MDCNAKQWQCAKRDKITDYYFEIVTKVDWTLKIEIGNEVFLPFLSRISAVEIEIFEVVSKTFVEKLFARNEV